ncbi:MAG TPA: hypothetical protein VJ970_01300, partial [Flavobacteriaceae bacterium]|nr:hypothetical protein [Flavobacteriaceae bacterium]
MYKVFVNEHPIILTEHTTTSFGLQRTNFKYINIYELVEKLFQNEILGIHLLCENLETDWKTFQNYFKVQVAAGGKVYNEEKGYLFIYRFNKWDLPKGKI